MPADRGHGGGRGLKILTTLMAFSAFLVSSPLTSELPGSVAAAHAASKSKVPPCQAAFPDAHRKTIGQTTWYNGQESMRMVLCYRFGLDPSADFPISSSMVCGVLAQVIGKGSVKLGVFADGACSGADLASDPKEPVKYISTACGWASDLLGVFVKPLGALGSAGCTLAPSAGNAFGSALESVHEFEVAVDVVRHGKCIKRSPTHFGSPWLAVKCSRGDHGFSTLPLATRPSGGGPTPGGGGSNPGLGASTGTWTIRSAPSASGTLLGVSCPNSSFCMAVGDGDGGGGDGTLAATWNGSAWTVVPPPDPNAEGNYLASVECESTSFCIAVGSHREGVSSGPLIERWNGSVWSAMVSPAVSEGILTGVSCVSESWCIAAGRTESGGGLPLIEHWDGSGWSTQSVPVPPSSDEVDFSSVSCASQSSCEAVGSYDNDQGLLTGTAFADHWDGSVWSLRTTPATPDAAFSGLAGVDCANPSSCAAVGYFDRGLGTRAFPVADLWNGGSWSNVPTPSLPAGAISGETVNVACPAVGACVAVGYEYDGSRSRTLAMSGGGASWTIEPTPAVSSAEIAELEDVSCPSSATCFAVGASWETASAPVRALVEERSG
jgi:hypothetical protein